MNGIDNCASFVVPSTDEEYKSILKEKNLIDENGNIKNEELKGMLDFAKNVKELMKNKL